MQHTLGLRHEVIVEKSLPLGQSTHDYVLVFLWHLLLDVLLQPTQQERTEDLINTYQSTRKQIWKLLQWILHYTKSGHIFNMCS